MGPDVFDWAGVVAGPMTKIPRQAGQCTFRNPQRLERKIEARGPTPRIDGAIPLGGYLLFLTEIIR